MQQEIICTDGSISLRKRSLYDIDKYIYLQHHGTWKDFDAPWETSESDDEIRQSFIKSLEYEKTHGIVRAVITNSDHVFIGTVNKYKPIENNQSVKIGIDILLDEFENQGIGTKALRLWIDYLFKTCNYHRIGLDTYSFNIRMIKVARKVGFKEEGVEREIRFWNNQWIALHHFGLLDREWNADK